MSGATAPIAGRYRVEGRLGVGGMSTVMLAFDERLERYVALKLLAEHLADDPTFVSRFRREALAAARLIHPNIVQVYDFGLDRSISQHFIVMEHVAGRSCAELLRERGHLDVGQTVEIVSQACRGLDYAHRNGVVHRDVKPGNLLVSDAGTTKLADFGIARATNQSSITQVGSVLGTAAYLAPEQARGEVAGPRADLYSLGVVTYQLLSGRLPYEAGSLSELALKQQRELPTPLRQLNPEVPRELAQAIELAISIDPEERPGDAVELGELLRDGARGISPYEEAAPPPAATARTRALTPRADPTAATRIVAAPRRTAATPRQVPAGRPPLADPPTPVPGYGRSGPARWREEPTARGGRAWPWTVAILLGLIVVIAVVVVILASSRHGVVVHYQQIVAHDAQSAIAKLKAVIAHYTGG
ncbi:protein kinase [Conexibacter sp. DBS9H8]|uniref:protein kinase domain-containing protein n=1 Tax=Conexibacter sp. DBS9H8 TaxID=2937801 RepID=UPI00200F96DA|nr:protein kinase [Conexibacter sp. DBS9H8]